MLMSYRSFSVIVILLRLGKSFWLMGRRVYINLKYLNS